MPGMETLQEYVVKLGAKVDTGATEKFTASVKKMVTGLAGLTAGFVAISAATLKFVDNQIKSDRELAKTASKLKISKQEAFAYNEALQTLGVTADELKDNKELKAEFDELYNLGKKIGRMDGAEEGMQTLKSFGQEINKLKITARYALRWIQDGIIQHLRAPLMRLQKWLASMRIKLMKNIQTITRVIQKGVRIVVGVIETAAKVVGGLIWLLGKIPSKLKLALGIGGGLLALIKSGPIGWFVTALVAILLLLEDFMYYKDAVDKGLDPNKYSAFGGIWDYFYNEKTKSQFDAIQESSENMLKMFKDLGEAVGGVFQSLMNLFGFEISPETELLSFFEALLLAIQLAAEGLGILADRLKGFFNAMNGLINKDKRQAQEGFAHFSTGEVDPTDFFSVQKRLDYNDNLVKGNNKKQGKLESKAEQKKEKRDKKAAKGKDTSKLDQEIEKLENKIQELQSSTAQANDETKQIINNYDQVGEGFQYIYQDNFEKETRDYIQSVRNGTQSTDHLTESTQQTNDGLDALSKTAQITDENTNHLGKATDQTAQSIEKLGNNIDITNDQLSNFSLPSNHIPASGGTEPQNAEGGIYSNEQRVRISEGNRPEAIIPLKDSKRSRRLLDEAAKKVGYQSKDYSQNAAVQTAMHNMNVANAAKTTSNQTTNNYHNYSVSAPVTVTGATQPQETSKAIDQRNAMLIRNLKGKVS